MMLSVGQRRSGDMMPAGVGCARYIWLRTPSVLIHTGPMQREGSWCLRSK